MVKHSWLRLALVLFSMLSVIHIGDPALAQNISVTIDGQAPVNPAPDASCNNPAICINIGGTYGVLQIDPYAAGTYARVDVPVAQTTQDTLQIINARITNNDSNDKTFTILFERRDVQLPNTSKWYNTYAVGNFGGVNGNSITVASFYKPDGGTYQQAGTTLTYTVQDCPPPDACTTTIPSNRKTGKQFNPAGNPRWLKVQVDITLKAGSFVDLNSGVRMVTSTNPPDIPKETSNPFCLTAQSTIKVSNCPECMTSDGQVTAEAKVRLFASTNWDNLSQDMARGQGEYLVALATMLKIPSHQESRFFDAAQEQYRTSHDGATPEQVVASLQATWNRQYER